MSYSLELHRKAIKELSKMEASTRAFIAEELDRFIGAYSPEYEAELIKTGAIKHLKGEWNGFYRLRLRTYRVIYEKIEERLVVHVVRIAHRREVY